MIRTFATAVVLACAVIVTAAQSRATESGRLDRDRRAGPPAVQPARGPEAVDQGTLGRIRDEGLQRSEVMDHIRWLSEVYGPRLTGGPNILRASDWAIRKFNEWGLANARREYFPLGRGWSLVRFHAHLIEPVIQPIIGFPHAWTRGTNGVVSGQVVRVEIGQEADFDKYRGTLAGRIVLLQTARDVSMIERPVVLRMTEKELAEARTTPVPRPRAPRDPARTSTPAAADFRDTLMAFFAREGVLAVFDRGADSAVVAGGSDLAWQTQRTDGGTVFPGIAPRNGSTTVPLVTLAVEHYNRMVRVLGMGLPVRMELQVDVAFHDEQPNALNGFNTIAELPGSDPRLRDEIVLLGAHVDSMAAATGATDNATGAAAVMEALRILKVVGAAPRRTIRVALWGGEEQGLLGSRAYVKEHLGDVSTMALKPEHARLSAYYNSDNGTGRIRGIWTQGNIAVVPIFQAFFEPLADLGVVAVGPRSVASTDHVPFDAIGVPAFQVMVDRLEYNARTHHSNMDVYDRVQPEDMVQHATVLAVLAYQTAMREEKLPRKTLPAAQPARNPAGTGAQP